MNGGGRPLLYAKIWRILIHPLQNADFRNASAITPSKKVQLTLIESPLRAFEPKMHSICWP